MTSHVTHIIEKETVYTWIFSWERDLGKGITNRFLCRYEETQLILASVTNSLVPIRGSPDIGHIFNCLSTGSILLTVSALRLSVDRLHPHSHTELDAAVPDT